VLQELGIEYEVVSQGKYGEEDSQRLIQDTPFITISNHPYGHIDGIILADYFGHQRADYKLMVNQILGRIEPLSPSFITVTRQAKRVRRLLQRVSWG
ncbi:MAG: hypothetical protein IIX50_00090, partial [Bacteroidaceae bacterium]|nr:hypothetical protein [Bacteroidaceae bacterium]